MLKMKVLAAPLDGIARRQRDGPFHCIAGRCDVTAEVAACDVDIDIADQSPVFALDLGGAIGNAQLRNLAQRYLHAGRRGDPACRQGVERITVAARVAQIDGETLASVDDRTDILARDRALNQILYVRDAHTVARGLGTIHLDVDVAPARHAFGEHRAGTGHLADDGFDLLREIDDAIKLGAGDLDADGGADAGGQHVDAGTNGITPGVGETGQVDGPVELVDDVLDRFAGRPLLARL